MQKKSQRGSSLVALLIILGITALLYLNRSKLLVNTKLITPIAQEKQQTTQTVDIAAKKADLEKYLTVETALLGISDNVSLYFKDLTDNSEISIDPTKSWIPASTIKSYVVLEAFRQRSLGQIDFDKRITIQAQNVVPTELETEEFPKLREGTEVTIRQLVEAMVIQSDNTAYNTLLDILDRKNINANLRTLGITETVVGEKLNLDDDQFSKDLQVPGRQPNTTTVKDLGTFFDLLYNKKVTNADEILAIFKRQKINSMLPAFLPGDVVVAHKTGDWAPIYNDGGVIFKPSNPFILTIFTNSDDPKIIAKLAKVAYFQDPNSVGKSLSLNSNPIAHSDQVISLANPPSADVLAASSDTTLPTISASDLGIKQEDLSSNPKISSDIRPAFILPGSILYDIKKYFEGKQFDSNSSKAKAYLALSKNRLAEVKSLLLLGNIKDANNTLKESETDLEQATTQAANDPDKQAILLEVKQITDLHFSVLADRAESVSDAQKKQFIDSVYNFYQQNTTQVKPVINTSIIASPSQQKPALGIITDVNNNVAKIQFDDGTSKDLVLTEDTKVRAFQQDSYQNVNKIKKGDKIAVLGQVNAKSQIVPQFILENVPKELPQVHSGTIIEIDPKQQTIKVEDNKGQQQTIKIDQNTNIKGKDTDVSLDGIKAGSQVTFFGTTTETITSSAAPKNSLNSSPQPQGVKATSITVTKNDSGKNERSSQTSSTKKVNNTPAKAVEPPKPEPKKEDSKGNNDKK